MKSYPAIEAALNKCGMPIVPPGHRCVAIVDPPRGGLHPKVTKALRNCTAIDTLIYVSCNPFGSFIEDAVRLCLPENDNANNKRYGKHCIGKPFVPLRAAPVDMFPGMFFVVVVCCLLQSIDIFVVVVDFILSEFQILATVNWSLLFLEMWKN